MYTFYFVLTRENTDQYVYIISYYNGQEKVGIENPFLFSVVFSVYPSIPTSTRIMLLRLPVGWKTQSSLSIHGRHHPLRSTAMPFSRHFVNIIIRESPSLDRANLARTDDEPPHHHITGTRYFGPSSCCYRWKFVSIFFLSAIEHLYTVCVFVPFYHCCRRPVSFIS